MTELHSGGYFKSYHRDWFCNSEPTPLVALIRSDLVVTVNGAGIVLNFFKTFLHACVSVFLIHYTEFPLSSAQYFTQISIKEFKCRESLMAKKHTYNVWWIKSRQSSNLVRAELRRISKRVSAAEDSWPTEKTVLGERQGRVLKGENNRN